MAKVRGVTVRRVLVIGCGGAGKSTFSRELEKRTGLPVVHLDLLYWNPNWVKTPPEQWKRVVMAALANERWVMDGNYGGTLPLRLEACDTVVYLDMPRWVCLARVVQRRVQAVWRRRSDLAVGCRERLTWEFLVWIWDYRRSRRPKILDRLNQLRSSKAIHVLASEADVRQFLLGLERG